MQNFSCNDVNPLLHTNINRAVFLFIFIITINEKNNLGLINFFNNIFFLLLLVLIDKRRNTISSIISPSNQTNNSSTTTITTTTKREETASNKKTTKSNLIKKKLNTIFDADIFELIEKSDLDQLQHKLVFNLSCINRYILAY